MEEAAVFGGEAQDSHLDQALDGREGGTVDQLQGGGGASGGLGEDRFES